MPALRLAFRNVVSPSLLWSEITRSHEVLSARRKGRGKRGGDHRRVPLDEAALAVDMASDDLLDLDDALTALELIDEQGIFSVSLARRQPKGEKK